MTSPTHPQCDAAGCTEGAVVQWRRRPTDAELAAAVADEQARRDRILANADPQLPAPEFGPPPTAEDTVVAVRSCAGHAIGLDDATHIHPADCTALTAGCACDLQPAPPAPLPTPDLSALPPGWVPAATGAA